MDISANEIKKGGVRWWNWTFAGILPPSMFANVPTPDVVNATEKIGSAHSISGNILERSSSPMQGADLHDCNLRGVNLEGMDLTGANLTSTDLTGANLRGANLHDAKLTGACLRNIDLRSAKLTKANLDHADLTNAKLDGANISGATLNGVIFFSQPT